MVLCTPTLKQQGSDCFHAWSDGLFANGSSGPEDYRQYVLNLQFAIRSLEFDIISPGVPCR